MVHSRGTWLPPDGRHWLLFDGACGFCRRAVAWVQRRDTRSHLRPIPFQEAPSPPMTPELYAACVRAVHVITSHGHVLRAGRACLFVLGEAGYGFIASLLRLPPLIWLVEIGYVLVSTHRDFFARFFFFGDVAASGRRD
jgi:predicted DCC family thiol-disulfide oxidoreductase YuxK